MEKLYKFKNGLTLAYSKVEKNRPLAVYFGVKVGSFDEKKKEYGITHFIEHLLFKGSNKRGAQQISREFEDIGADINASTSGFSTSFRAIGLDENIEKTIELLSDMVLNPKFDESEIEKERQVIFEEIDMHKESPDACLSKAFNKMFYKGTGVDHSVIGTKKCLRKLSREDIVAYYNKHYISKNIIISVATNHSFKEVKQLVEKYTISMLGNRKKVLRHKKCKEIEPQQFLCAINKDFAQARVMIAFPLKKLEVEERLITGMMAFALGGGFSSRLFTKIREENGLVYTIDCSITNGIVGGSLHVYFGCNPTNCKKTVEMVKAELEEFVKNGITEEELKRTKALYKSSYLRMREKSKSIARDNLSIVSKKEKLGDYRIKIIENAEVARINELARKHINFDKVCAIAVGKGVDDSMFECLKSDKKD